MVCPVDTHERTHCRSMDSLKENMKEIYTEQEAADYLGLTSTYMHSLRRTKRGPAFTKPSQRVIRYRKSDLDAWREGWATVSHDVGGEDR